MHVFNVLKFNQKIQLFQNNFHNTTKVIPSDLSSVVNNAEISIVLELLGFLELGVRSLLLNHLLYKGFVCGFGEPTLFIKQSQDAWWTGLKQTEGHIWLFTVCSSRESWLV